MVNGPGFCVQETKDALLLLYLSGKMTEETLMLGLWIELHIIMGQEKIIIM